MRRFLPHCLLCMLATAGHAAADETGMPAPAGEAVEAVDSIGAIAVAPAPALRWSLSGAPADGGYRVSLARGALDFSALFEPRVGAARPIETRFDSAAFASTTLPALSFGLRTVHSGPAPASSLVERALGTSTAVSYVSKVGLEWKPTKPQVFLNHGLGFRFGGDDKLTMRLRKGVLGLYFKSNF